MELTVVRVADQRRMVVAVDAHDETEALRTIQNAMGPAEIVRESNTARPRRADLAGRHARVSTAF